MECEILLSLFLSLGVSFAAFAESEIFEDFEGGYDRWRVEGEAFGSTPAPGAAKHQQAVSGYRGEGLVNSYFEGGDSKLGKLILKKPLRLNRRYLNVLIGGGGDSDRLYLRVLHKGRELGRLSGGFDEVLVPKFLDLKEALGGEVSLEIVDAASGSWGHINVDDISFFDEPVGFSASEFELVGKDNFLLLPISGKAGLRRLSIEGETKGGGRKTIYTESIPLDFENPQWFAPMSIKDFKGKKIFVKLDAKAGEKIVLNQSPSEYMPDFMCESLRPQYHITAPTGWLNDPNGLVFYKGLWHAFYQYSPAYPGHGAKYWRHKSSADLMAWREAGLAMDVWFASDGSRREAFSGTAFADEKNLSGAFKSGGGVIFAYTRTGSGEHLACSESSDLSEIREFDFNPVIRSPGRDPRIFYFEKNKEWVILRYEEVPNEGKTRKTFAFYTSKNLRDWEKVSELCDFYECPDIFELKVEGDKPDKKFVIFGASGDYEVGDFDGRVFKRIGARKSKVLAEGAYAAQTFANAPGGRRIALAWVNQDAGAMCAAGASFSQCLSIPFELSLKKSNKGDYYMCAYPAREVFDKLLPPLKDKGAVPTSSMLDISLNLNDCASDKVEISPGEVIVTYDRSNFKLRLSRKNGEFAREAQIENPNLSELNLKIFLDRSVVCAVYGEGQKVLYSPLMLGDKLLTLKVSDSGKALKRLEIYPIKSMYD